MTVSLVPCQPSDSLSLSFPSSLSAPFSLLLCLIPSLVFSLSCSGSFALFLPPPPSRSGYLCTCLSLSIYLCHPHSLSLRLSVHLCPLSLLKFRMMNHGTKISFKILQISASFFMYSYLTLLTCFKTFIDYSLPSQLRKSDKTPFTCCAFCA